MNIKGSVALVTGSNRGIGRCIRRGASRGEAAKVYASVADPALGRSGERQREGCSAEARHNRAGGYRRGAPANAAT